jgi:hypothetical protein
MKDIQSIAYKETSTAVVLTGVFNLIIAEGDITIMPLQC